MAGYGKSTQTILQRNPLKDVYAAAQERIRTLFDSFPAITVCFSGGKDSTVVLHLALAEAQRRGQSLTVVLSDEEAVDPDTEAYLHQVSQWPGVRFQWCCAPVQHTFRGLHRMAWICWDPTAAAVWVRPQPLHAICADPFWTFPMALDRLGRNPAYPKREQCVLVGVRAAESFNRHRAMLGAGTYLTEHRVFWYAKPIYDWKTTDVWTVIRREGWPYSAYYDKLHRLGLARHTQRVAPMGNVASLSRMHYWAMLYPAFWERVLGRFPEMAAMARYGQTRLYRKGTAKLPGQTWQEWVWQLLAFCENVATRTYWNKQIQNALLRWERVYSIPFPETAIQTVDGKSAQALCWQRLAMMISKNDRFQGSSRDLT